MLINCDYAIIKVSIHTHRWGKVDNSPPLEICMRIEKENYLLDLGLAGHSAG